MNTDTVVEGLTLYYTNADNLVNKRDELQIIINDKNPDILIITEVFPKNVESTKVLPAELNFDGYTFYVNNIKKT